MCGWLDLNGKFYSCEEYEHISLADELEEKLGLRLFDNENYIPFHGERLLEKLGWIKFTQSEFYRLLDDYPDKGYVFVFTGEHQLTKKQINWLLDSIDKFSPNQIEMIKKIFEEQMDAYGNN